MSERLTFDTLAEVRPTAALFSFVTEVAEVTKAATARRNLAAAFDRCVRELERSRERMDEGHDLLSAYIDRMLEAGEVDPATLSSDIDRLERLQRRMDGEFAEIDRALGVIKAFMPKTSPKAVRQLDDILGQYETHRFETLNLFKDARWRMMAVRATLIGDGETPEFSNPADLKAYLSTAAE